MQTDPIESISYKEYSILWGGGTNICQKFWWVSLCLEKHSDGMPCTDVKCLNAKFISYSTQLPSDRIFFYSNIFFFWRSTFTHFCKHFPKSICREFISPVGYFFFIKGAQGIPHMEYWSTHSTGHNQLSHTWNIDAPTVQGTISHPPHGILIRPHVVQGTINHPPTWNIGPPTVQSTINHPPHGILVHPQYRAQSTIPHMEYWSTLLIHK